MRVIAGTFKKTNLYSPKDNMIRPTTDRTKEALFSIIGSRIYDSKFLDLFSGTGSIAIEAVSRGASSVTSVDSSRESIELIKANQEKVKTEFSVVFMDVEKYIEKTMNVFDIIFLDPPYEMKNVDVIIEKIFEKKLTNYLILEFPKGFKLIDNQLIIREKRYGKSSIYIIEKRVYE